MESPRGVSLDEKRAFLSRSETYGRDTTAVQVVETHMSLVFLTEGHAYKLKKPVHYPYLDFRALEARARYCEEELRLNRRLSKDVYINVLPLTLTGKGALALGGQGKAVDWLVHMRRLPKARFLDHVILAGAVSTNDVERVGAPLVAFYQALPPAEVDPSLLVGRFAAEHETSITSLRRHPFGLSTDMLDLVDRAQRGFLQGSCAPLRERVAQGRIVDGHGDLRPEHVHLGPPVNIIDCLEFSRWLRLVDPFEELSFLAMECERLGAEAFAEGLLAYCSARLAEPPPDRLMYFYKSFRALLRARLTILHLTEPGPRDPEKWPKLAAAYLNLAARYAGRLMRSEAR